MAINKMRWSRFTDANVAFFYSKHLCNVKVIIHFDMLHQTTPVIFIPPEKYVLSHGSDFIRQSTD